MTRRRELRTDERDSQRPFPMGLSSATPGRPIGGISESGMFANGGFFTRDEPERDSPGFKTNKGSKSGKRTDHVRCITHEIWPPRRTGPCKDATP